MEVEVFQKPLVLTRTHPNESEETTCPLLNVLVALNSGHSATKWVTQQITKMRRPKCYNCIWVSIKAASESWDLNSSGMWHHIPEWLVLNVSRQNVCLISKVSRREVCRKEVTWEILCSLTHNMRRMLQKIRYSLIVLSSNSIARK